MVALKSISWSWMDDSHPFHSRSTSRRIPETSLFQTLEICRSRSWVWSKGKVIRSAQHLPSFSFHINQANNSWDTSILKFHLEKSKIKVMSECKGRGNIVYPVSIWSISFSFHINWTNHFWDMTKRPKKNTSKFVKENLPKKVSNRISSRSNQVISMTRGDTTAKFCSDWMSGSDFIVQTSKFLLINVTVVTLGQGHRKATQYISPDHIFFVPNM